MNHCSADDNSCCDECRTERRAIGRAAGESPLERLRSRMGDIGLVDRRYTAEFEAYVREIVREDRLPPAKPKKAKK